jgi:hypothetical protein
MSRESLALSEVETSLIVNSGLFLGDLRREKPEQPAFS